MNIYICDAGVMSVYQETIAYYPRYEDERVFNLVVAETRGKAKAMFISCHDLEFVGYKISIRKVISDVDIVTPGMADNWAYEWKDYDKIIEPYEDECWAIVCRKNLMGDNKEHTDCADPTECPYIKLCRSEALCRYEKEVSQ